MLVLTRKIGEQVLVPELNITVTVISTGANRVQLGFQAPQQVNITRPERHCPQSPAAGTVGQRVVTYSSGNLRDDASAIESGEPEFVVA